MLVALFAVSATTLAVAQDDAVHRPPVTAASIADRYPHGSIRSVPVAERALSDVNAARSAVEARFSSEQGACYSKFFAASCMNDAKERRRAALERLRAVEVDANFFLRQARAAQRDRDTARKRARDESERAEREQQAASTLAKRARAAGKQSQANTAPQGTPDPDRIARHEEKLTQMREKEAAEARQRAANVAAYDRKAREAQARQQEVARKKAEKERERAGKATPDVDAK